MGMVPDLATLRDRAKGTSARSFTVSLSLGWHGSARAWHRYEIAYMILAALSTPLVLSVHTVVSFDFAVSQLPGWHTTIFPPYFVAGAIFSGFAMVVTLLVPARELFGLKNLITMRHLENMNKIIMATGLMVGTAYGIEFFISWYSQVEVRVVRVFEPGPRTLRVGLLDHGLLQRDHPPVVLVQDDPHQSWLMVFVSICVNIGMWFERFVIVVTSLASDFLPSSWGYFRPTWVDIGMLVGSFGLFTTLFLLFCRFLPAMAIAEVKLVAPAAEHS